MMIHTLGGASAVRRACRACRTATRRSLSSGLTCKGSAAISARVYASVWQSPGITSTWYWKRYLASCSRPLQTENHDGILYEYRRDQRRFSAARALSGTSSRASEVTSQRSSILAPVPPSARPAADSIRLTVGGAIPACLATRSLLIPSSLRRSRRNRARLRRATVGPRLVIAQLPSGNLLALVAVNLLQGKLERAILSTIAVIA